MQLPELSILFFLDWVRDQASQRHGLSQSRRGLTGAVEEQGCRAAREVIESCFVGGVKAGMR